jgi:hypothetical protein
MERQHMRDRNDSRRERQGGKFVRSTADRVQLVTLYTRVILELIRNPRISQETLARHLDVTMRTAQRHLTELEEEDYISVDRTKKPFEYTINWEKAWPHVEWLRVMLYNPNVRGPVQDLVDVAYRTYSVAESDGGDPKTALDALFAKRAEVSVS